MRNGIVEGEPGIFPDPIARFFRWLGRLGRRRDESPPAPPTQQEPSEPE